MKIFGNLKMLEKEDNSQKQLSSIKSNAIDNYSYVKALGNYEESLNRIAKMSKDEAFFDKLNQDLFHGLYKVQPEFYHKDNVYESLELENDLARELMDNDAFNQLRQYTVTDDFMTAFSMKSFQQKAYEIIEEWKKESQENEEYMEKVNEAIKEQNKLQGLINDLEDDPDDKEIQEQVEKQMKKIDECNNNIKSKGPSKESMENVSSGLSNAFREMKKETTNMQEDFKNLGLGSDAPGNPTRVTYKDKEKMADALMHSRKIKKISKMLGKIKDDLSKVGQRPSHIGSEISDVGIGNNLNKILSTEKTKLIDKDFEMDFLKRFTDKELLELKTKGFSKNKGPVIMCIDISGSISDDENRWSMAIASALLQIAQSEKREYRAITFNSDVHRVIDFEVGKYNAEKIIELLSISTCGGTNFYRPLEKALDSVSESKFKKADILFLTDGEPSNHLPSRFLKKLNMLKKEKELMIQSIMLGGNNTRYLDEFSDSIITIDDIEKDEEVIKALKNIRDKS